MTPAVVLEQVDFAYADAPVLRSVDVCIHPGEFVCIVGPNGGGKTTLVKLLVGLLTPQRGTVRVFGEPPVVARRRVGYMPQQAQLDPQFPVSVLDVVLMGRAGSAPIFGGYRRDDREAARAALRDVELSDLASRSFAALSGGQRQRVLLARALVCQPQLLLLDEPMANLDIKVQDDLYRLLHDLSQRMTIIMVSHDVRFVSEQVRRVVCVNRTVHTHPTAELTIESISALFGHNVRVIRHDHDEARHQH